MQAENARLMPNKVKILADVVKADGDGTVDFALLGAKGHEVLSGNKEATRAGMSTNQLNSTRQWKNFAPAEKMVYKDVNNDGITDVVFTFKAKDVAKGAVAGAAMDLWLYTQITSHRVTGFDVVPVENDKVKMKKGATTARGSCNQDESGSECGAGLPRPGTVGFGFGRFCCVPGMGTV